MTSAQFVDDVVSIAVALSKFAVAVSPIAVALGPVFIPLIAGTIKNKKHAQAFETVTRMGLLATNVAAEAMAKGMKQAQEADSPGGTTITAEEMETISAKAGVDALKWAQDQKVLDQVLDVYGGREAVLQSLRAIINAKLHGTPVGPAPASKPIESPCASVEAKADAPKVEDKPVA